MRHIRYFIYACLCSQLMASVVVAAGTAPPEPSLRKSPAAWMGFGLMFVFFAVVVVVSLMSSKRGHQE